MRKLLIVFAALALVAGSAIPVLATDWSFYGKAAMFTYMNDVSKEKTGNVDDSDLVWTGFNSSNRLGFNAKGDDIGANFEVGIDMNYAGDANSFHVRTAYGWWNFGAGKLTLGQQYGPACFFPSGFIRGDNSLVSYGAVYSARIPQIKLTMGGFNVSLIETNKAGALGGANDQDVSIPKIEASYDIPVGPVALHIFGGYNSYEDVVIAGTTETSYDIDATIFGIGFKFATGPFYLNGDLWMAQNPGNYGMAQDNSITKATLTGTTVNDADSMVYAAILGYKVTPMITLEAGMGVISNELEAGGVTAEAETTTIYLQAPITLAKGVSITPEVGTIDYGDIKPGTGERGDITWYGARWLIVF
jgi:hypothetical protein